MSDLKSKQEIELLLPFYVNGSLDDKEVRLVKQAIADDKSLQQEVDLLQQLQTHVKQKQKVNTPGEFGLKRLQKSLKKQQIKDQELRQQADISSGKSRWQIAAVAACLMLVVQTTVNLIPEPTEYEAAGGDVLSLHKGKIISVTFTPGSSEQSIRNLLLAANVLIVDGPSALGVYQLSVSKDIKSTIDKLRARTDVIETVQE